MPAGRRRHRVGPHVLAFVLALSCLVNGQAGGVQTFDMPAAGARSPRNASYDIDVRLDHAARTLTGSETIRWRNISAATTTELQFHLYWNAWRDDESTWIRERRLAGLYRAPRPDAWSASDVTALRVRRPTGDVLDLTAEQRFLAPDDGNARDRTVMAVTVPWEIQPNETLEIEVEWTARVPRTFARTGYIDDYYFIAHWFPKMGVLEDTGWNTHQFHAATEFYADYGVYDVRITVPTGFVVGASGYEVLRQEQDDGTTLHRYQGEDIHDFAWTTSPRFMDATRPFDEPGLPRVEMRLLLQPEHAGQEDRHFEATAATLRHFGQWFGPYPYDHITVVDPAYQSGSGGMEYPTLFTAGTRWLAPADAAQPESVTIHEAGHQFFYGIVGSNEFEHAWMDEGLTTFGTARAMEEAGVADRLPIRVFDGFIPWVLRDVALARATDRNRLATYRRNAEADAQATPSFRYWPGTATAVTYDKTALWLHTLERHLGWPVLQRAMSTYFDRWKFRHPQPADFFAAVSDAAGRDMDWFFDQTYRSSNTFDYGVQTLTSTRDGDNFQTTVVARRYGEATFPVEVVTRFRDGEEIREQWDGLDRRVIYTYDRPAEALAAIVDPGRVLLLDVNFTNNSRTLEPRAAEASLKWTLTWLVWLQDLMLTYGFFV